MAITIDPTALTHFFIALFSLLLAAHTFGYIFNRFALPRVVGEIVGGILLGPTFLGYFFPNVYHTIFIEQGVLLATLYWLGLVLLMFTSGFELERKFDKADKKTILALVLGTTLIPLLFGWVATSFFDLNKLAGPANNLISLKLVITVSLAITSIPVLSKIFLDLGIIKTSFAKLVLATATIHDIILWVFISIATGLVTTAAISFTNIFFHVLISILFFLVALMLVPRIIDAIAKLQLRLIPLNYELPVIVLILLAFTVIASLLNINLVFGAFLAGIVINFIRNPRFQDAKQHIKDFSLAFLIPIYFAVVGLKIDLIHHLDLSFLALFILFAIVVQTIAVLITTRLLKYDWLTSFNFAVALNDRGGPCIVLATVAFDLGIINETFFVTLILLAIITSLTAGIWFKYVVKKGWSLLESTNKNRSESEKPEAN
ncbi:cation:proton antiporter [Candidatus Woesearchaeota archaeon]|nr:cation:proton antiporter [Candidatus Woesearchaeota archaeon]